MKMILQLRDRHNMRKCIKRAQQHQEGWEPLFQRLDQSNGKSLVGSMGPYWPTGPQGGNPFLVLAHGV